MSDEKKDSSFRGRIDRFFDKQAKEQQNLLQGKVGGTSIKDSWEEVKGKVGSKKSKASIGSENVNSNNLQSKDSGMNQKSQLQ